MLSFLIAAIPLSPFYFSVIGLQVCNLRITTIASIMNKYWAWMLVILFILFVRECLNVCMPVLWETYIFVMDAFKWFILINFWLLLINHPWLFRYISFSKGILHNFGLRDYEDIFIRGWSYWRSIGNQAANLSIPSPISEFIIERQCFRFTHSLRDIAI